MMTKKQIKNDKKHCDESKWYSEDDVKRFKDVIKDYESLIDDCIERD